MSSVGNFGCTRPGKEQAHEKLSLAGSVFIFFCGEVTCERKSVLAGLFACGLLFTAVVGSANNRVFVQMYPFEKYSLKLDKLLTL